PPRSSRCRGCPSAHPRARPTARRRARAPPRPAAAGRRSSRTDDAERQRRDGRPAVDEEQRRRILALAADFPLVWNDPNTPARERKRMLALLIEDVTIIKQRELTVSVRFRAGTTT